MSRFDVVGRQRVAHYSLFKAKTGLRGNRSRWHRFELLNNPEHLAFVAGRGKTCLEIVGYDPVLSIKLLCRIIAARPALFFQAAQQKNPRSVAGISV